MGLSLVRLKRIPDKDEIVGSNPTVPTVCSAWVRELIRPQRITPRSNITLLDLRARVGEHFHEEGHEAFLEKAV